MHSNIVLTIPPGNSGFPEKTPNFSSIIHTPVSKRGEIRASLQPYPIWEIEYPAVEFVRGAEQDNGSLYQTLVGMFVAMGGQFGDFLYQDPRDHTIPDKRPANPGEDPATIPAGSGAVYFGTGDGSSTLFQLTRPIGIGADIVQNLNGNPVIYVNGTATSAFTVEPLGVISFSTPPASGAILTWSGSYYYRVRFADDHLPFEEFMYKVWNLKNLKLVSVIL